MGISAFAARCVRLARRRAKANSASPPLPPPAARIARETPRTPAIRPLAIPPSWQHQLMLDALPVATETHDARTDTPALADELAAARRSPSRSWSGRPVT